MNQLVVLHKQYRLPCYLLLTYSFVASQNLVGNTCFTFSSNPERTSNILNTFYCSNAYFLQSSFLCATQSVDNKKKSKFRAEITAIQWLQWIHQLK